MVVSGGRTWFNFLNGMTVDRLGAGSTKHALVN